MSTANPSRLTIARSRRRLTKAALAEAIGVTAATIGNYEAGKSQPSPAVVSRLARVLGFPLEFFSGPDVDLLTDQVSFRSLSRLRARDRDSAQAAGTIALLLDDWIETRFHLPPPQLPDLAGLTAEEAAEALRADMGLGEAPIAHLIGLLEAHGVRAYSLNEECADLDAFSFWWSGTPYMLLNTIKTGERGRMDAAHELAHLTMHRHAAPGARDLEHDAREFASAFLLPRRPMLSYRRRSLSLADVLTIKRHWLVSAMAVVVRMRRLSLISDWNYRSLCQEISRRFGRRHEYSPIERERSRTLEAVFGRLRAEGITRRDVARSLNVPTIEVEALTFGLAPAPRFGVAPEDGISQPVLTNQPLRAV